MVYVLLSRVHSRHFEPTLLSASPLRGAREHLFDDVGEWGPDLLIILQVIFQLVLESLVDVIRRPTLGFSLSRGHAEAFGRTARLMPLQ